MHYRREIDGLRAIAVLPVILFHAGFEVVQGGFIGVDIFFVISGYLITSIILSELEQGKFSILNFYDRRARRILPALFFVMLISILFAWLWLAPNDMKDFSRSLFAVSLFISNILFWRDSGYFDTSSELKPLLHTWSLAVEEQYYILFPLFLILFWRFGKRFVVALLISLFIASLALAQWASLAKPAAAFYLLPMRGWELIIGAFAAFYLSKNRIPFSKTIGELGGSLGLVLIFYSIFVFSKATPFPGFYALVPTVGALLIILFATHTTTVGSLIGSRIFVGMGLISYSAYLWHQPLFAFARHAKLNLDSSLTQFALLSSITVLAYFSWKYVETPFRNKNKFSKRFIFCFSLTGIFFFLGLGYIGYKNNGFPKNVAIKEALTERRTDKNFIVIGDSHAEHLVSGLSAITSGSITNYTSGGCLPLKNVDRYDHRFTPGECVKKMNSALEKVLAEDPNAVVILSSMGPIYLDGTPFRRKHDDRLLGLGVELLTDKSIKDRWEVFEIGLKSTLRELSTLKRATIVYAIDVPELGIEQGCLILKKQITIGPHQFSDLILEKPTSECFVARKTYDERTERYKALITRIVADFPTIYAFDPTPIFCDATQCKGFHPQYSFLYRDVDHLSNAGSFFYAEKFVDFLNHTSILPKAQPSAHR